MQRAGPHASRSRNSLHQPRPLRRLRTHPSTRLLRTPTSSFPRGAAGIAMANLAARMGLETTGITLPSRRRQLPPQRANSRQAVIAGDSTIAQEAEKKLRADDTAFAESETHSRPVKANCASPIMRSAGVPRCWRAATIAARPPPFRRSPIISPTYGSRASSIYPSKRSATICTNFSPYAPAWASRRRALSSGPLDGPGRTAGARTSKPKSTPTWPTPNWPISHASKSRPATRRRRRQSRQSPRRHGLLRAKSGAALRRTGIPFHAASPTFSEDITIPWEGKRLVEAVRRGSAKIASGDEVKLVARVSEGPEERRKLQADLRDLLPRPAQTRTS